MKHAKIDDTQDDKQLVKMFVALLKPAIGREFNGYTAQQYMMDTYGIYTDHHVMTSIMDSMTRFNPPAARCTQGWGCTVYIIL